MRKVVLLQIVLATLAFVITAWVFFRIRPKVDETHQLQQQLTVAQQKNEKLEDNAKTLQGNHEQSRTYLRQGAALFHHQQYAPAIALYDKALEAYPNDPYGWHLKGYALFRSGRIQESIEANQRAVQLDPGNPLHFLNLAKSFCAAKQYDDAARALVVEPASDVAAEVRQYLQTDGEIRRVCRPILSRVSQATPQQTP